MKKVRESVYSIRCEDVDRLEFEDLLEEDLEDIENYLDNYVVKSVDKQKVDSTIDVLRSYMPVKHEEKVNEQIKICSSNNMQSISKLVKLQMGVTNKSYWLVSLMLILYGVISIKNINIDLTICSSIIAPIPILLGMVEFIRGRDENVWELELSYKYSLREMILAKSIIIISISMCISLIMSVISVNVYSQVNLLKVICVWLIPMCTIASISLLIVSVYKSINSIALCIAVWILGVTTVVAARIPEVVINISNVSMLMILGVCMASMILSLRVFYKNCIDYKSCTNFHL
ncbi:hypothetical protein CHL78_014130 [Romboutsia weinsteinii]|uniref:ABC-2 transporter permease n=1 Tax=Romboutsia weinsteinii TaxID=2020949 RepID=A0A371J0R5_9FIRM|nr:hypothetical protein [Romboutsia weinsteinii]RDY26315.1 hypothetical protein CHL78_014130 [Romboutsia weinsteinii]